MISYTILYIVPSNHEKAWKLSILPDLQYAHLFDLITTIQQHEDDTYALRRERDIDYAKLDRQARRESFAASNRKKGRVIIMGCGCKKDAKEVKGESIEFESFESNVPEEISAEEAEKQEDVAEELCG